MKKRKKDQKAEQKELQTNCRNMFHYLRRYQNLSNQRPTRCPCKDVKHNGEFSRSHDIRTFLNKFPMLEHKSPPTNSLSLGSLPSHTTVLIPMSNSFETRADAIRKQHDRGKKRKAKNTGPINVLKKHRT